MSELRKLADEARQFARDVDEGEEEEGWFGRCAATLARAADVVDAARALERELDNPVRDAVMVRRCRERLREALARLDGEK